MAARCLRRRPEPGGDGRPRARGPGGGRGRQGRGWNAANNPAAADRTFLYFAHQLPLSGGGPEPITSDYWAVARDNLNVKWDGDLSPAASLLARKDTYPRVGSTLNACEQKTAGTASETCTFNVPAAGGTYVVRAKNEKSGTVVTVAAELIE